MAHPERFDGRVVSLSAVYRPLDQESFQLFLSLEQARQLMQIDAIRVRHPDGAAEDLEPGIGPFQDLAWVRVTGRFRANTGRHPYLFIGEIELQAASALPTQPDPLPRR